MAALMAVYGRRSHVDQRPTYARDKPPIFFAGLVSLPGDDLPIAVPPRCFFGIERADTQIGVRPFLKVQAI